SPVSGGYGEGETPLPIPNREVKPLSADGTWLARAWESRSPPVFFEPRLLWQAGFSCLGGACRSSGDRAASPVGGHAVAQDGPPTGFGRRRRLEQPLNPQAAC